MTTEPARAVARRRRELQGAVAALVLTTVVLGCVGLPLADLLRRTVVSTRGGHRAGVGAIVVLGSTLQGGAVPPLLASRLDRAAALYRAEAAGGSPPLVVASGGAARGGTASEASAMAAYLVRCGVPAERLVQEDRSTTTQENLALTAALLQRRGPVPQVVVVTSDFHVRRTAGHARRSGLQVQVLGARTPHRLLPRALLREAALVLGQQPWAQAVGAVLGRRGRPGGVRPRQRRGGTRPHPG